ncbi:MAG TPA: hypothetical protein VEP66_06485 [Myxococcales bacterium]|nr:hypothetical protein [Myxococcales bacterium]
MDPRTFWKMSLRSFALVVIGTGFCWLSLRAESNLAQHQNSLPPLESNIVPGD